MKYTLQENAMSSIHVAIENFKKFYFYAKSYKESELDEARKLCAIFLENSIELLLKALLVKKDETSIYAEPDSKKNQNAKKEAKERNITLEDVLVEKGTFKTITYTQTIEKINESYHSERTKNVLLNISEYRNRLTHFGINTIENDEFTIACLNVFAVMYQNLYEKIITLEKIEPFFTDGKIFVRTIHGIKYLTDDNGIYNNIIDFFDELVELLPYVSLGYRIKKEKYNIQEYLLLLDNTISSPNFKKMIDYYGASLEMENCMDNILHSFELGYEDEAWDSLIPVYCPYYNATTYIGECGVIYFRILHSTREIVIYHEETDMPESNMPQYEESDWNSHIECGVAQKYSLTKRNIKKAFETIIQIMIDDRKNITSESDN